jgi:hypothetical protein
MKPKRQPIAPFHLTGQLLPVGMAYTLEWKDGHLYYGGYPYRFAGSSSVHDDKHVVYRTRSVTHWSAAEQIRNHFEQTYHFNLKGH